MTNTEGNQESHDSRDAPAGPDRAPMSRARVRRSVTLAVSAATIEGYDAAVFGVYAVVVGAKYFASDAAVSSLLMAMSAFAAGFVARPFGALLLGAIADRLGRRRAYALVVVLMSTATGLVGLLPTYATAGLAISIVVMLVRLLHGLAAGGSTATGTLYIAELVSERHRGLVVSAKQSASIGSFMLAVLCGTVFLSVEDALASTWAWRVPFIVALPFGLFGLWIQLYGEETAEFKAKREQLKTSNPMAVAWKSYKFRVFLATLSGILHNSSALVVFLFMPAYAVSQLGLSITDTIIAGSVSALLTICANTLGGHIADKIGFKHVMLISGALTLLLTYPCFVMLVSSPGLVALLIAQTTLGVVSGPFGAVNLAFKARLFPAEVRGTCLAVNNSLSALLFVGLASMFVQWMLEIGMQLAPAHYLAATSMLSIIGLIYIREKMLYAF